MNAKKYGDVNLYDLLGISIECEQVDIRKAYRKKALACHPDKHPDNPKAAELFHELAKALEILTDVTARAAYDKVLRAKQAAELRTKQLDSKRRKLKADLEQREREAQNKWQKAQSYKTSANIDEEDLEAQIQRLRLEGSRLVEEEHRLMREQLQRQMTAQTETYDSNQYRIKIKWKEDKNDVINGGYTKEKLQLFLRKYGNISAIVMSKRTGSALVEYQTREAAEMAMAYERGEPGNLLQLNWVTPPKPSRTVSRTTNTISDRDYEDLVMRQLRQAEERQRIIKEMQKEDDEQKNDKT